MHFDNENIYYFSVKTKFDRFAWLYAEIFSEVRYLQYMYKPEPNFVWVCLFVWTNQVYLKIRGKIQGAHSRTFSLKQQYYLSALARDCWVIYRGPGFFGGRMIWLLAHPLLSCSKFHFHRQHPEWLRKKDNLLTGGGGRGWAKSRIIGPQDSLALYKSFKIL
jgi:hypothetical protein